MPLAVIFMTGVSRAAGEGLAERRQAHTSIAAERPPIHLSAERLKRHLKTGATRREKP